MHYYLKSFYETKIDITEGCPSNRGFTLQWHLFGESLPKGAFGEEVFSL